MANAALWLFGASIIGVGGPSPAAAQQTSQDDTQSAAPGVSTTTEGKTQATSPAEVSRASAEDSSETTDIIVTARRRNELLQNVPIAVSAISAEKAERIGISGVEAITLVTPSLQFNREISQGATPFLRGVGSPQASAGGESPVAIYIDDVYIGSPNANMFAFNNIASVQVLKGPQGTLFGRNATGGVIQVETRRPNSDPSVEMKVGLGNYESREGSFYGNVPITDTLAFNVAAQGHDQNDGYGRSLLSGRETQKGWDWNVRSQLLWQPSAETRLLLIGDYGEQSSDFGSNGTPFPGTVSISGATYQGYNTQTAGTDYAKIKQGGVSLRVDHEASFADLVSITAYRYTRLAFTLDQDLGPPPLVQVGVVRSPTKSLSQEFRVVSKEDSAIKWIVGAYYLHTKTGYDPSRIGGLFFAPLNTISLYDEQTLNSYSVFGEATFDLLTNTHLTLGARYTKDKYELDVQGRIGNDTFPLPGNTFKQDDNFGKLTYRAIIDHQFTPNIMAYASYSRGFRSGGYQLAFPGNAANPSPVVQPEVLDSYELGAKTQFFHDRLTLNGAAFYYNYKNLAINFVQVGGNLVENAAGAHIKGVDIELVARPFSGLSISGGLGILDGEYTDFPNGPILLPNPATCGPPPAVLGPPVGGNRPCRADLTGRTSIRAPKLTFTIAPSYTLNTSVGDFTIAANYYHNSGFFWDVNNLYRQSSYDVLNGSLTWEDASKRYEVRLWARNLTDERYGIFASPNVLTVNYSLAAPRTYGATVGAKF